MNGRKIFIIFLFIFEIISLFCQTSQGTINIGFISNNPADILENNTVIADYIKTKLSNTGIKNCKLIIASNMDEMISLINSGKVDIFIDTIVPTLIIKKKTNIDIILRRWKKGVPDYKTIFITKKDSKLNDLSNLNGMKIGFEEETSTSARWVPQSILLQKGYKLVQLKDSNSVVPSDKVGFIFTRSFENTPNWIIQGKIDLGCISTTDYHDLSQSVISSLKIIGESKLMPRQLISVRHSLSNKISTEIKNLFLSMDKDPDSREVLKKWEKTTKMDEINPNILIVIQEFELLIQYVEKEIKL